MKNTQWPGFRSLIFRSCICWAFLQQAAASRMEALVKDFRKANAGFTGASVVHLVDANGNDLKWEAALSCWNEMSLEWMDTPPPIRPALQALELKRQCSFTQACPYEDVDWTLPSNAFTCRLSASPATGYCNSKCKPTVRCRTRPASNAFDELLQKNPGAKLQLSELHLRSVVENPSEKCSHPDEVTTLDKLPEGAITINYFKHYAQHAAAAYCNSEKKPGDVIQCGKNNCPDLEKAQLRVNNTFGGDYAVSGYIAVDEDKREIVLSFRGSVRMENWGANLQTWPTDCDTMYAPGCKVHSGFQKAWKGVSGQVMNSVKALSKQHKYRVSITGHSLGGALATLAAASLRHDGIVADAYTYGSPRVGNMVFANYVSSPAMGATHRMAHDADVVTFVPFALFGFAHTYPEYWIDAPSRDVEYKPSQIRRCYGIWNPNCGHQASLFSVTDHFYYFRDINNCKPTVVDSLKDSIGNIFGKRDEAREHHVSPDQLELPDGFREKMAGDGLRIQQMAKARQIEAGGCTDYVFENMTMQDGNRFESADVRQCNDDDLEEVPLLYGEPTEADPLGAKDSNSQASVLLCANDDFGPPCGVEPVAPEQCVAVPDSLKGQVTSVQPSQNAGSCRFYAEPGCNDRTGGHFDTPYPGLDLFRAASQGLQAYNDNVASFRCFQKPASAVESSGERWTWSSQTQQKLCPWLDELSLSFCLNDGLSAGTFDRIKLEFVDVGVDTQWLVEGPEGGFKTTKDINLLTIFNSSEVEVKRMRKIRVLDLVSSSPPGGDYWHLGGLEFRARCAGSGIKVKLDKFQSLNRWVGVENQMPVRDGRWIANWESKPYEAWADYINPEDWVAESPCSHLERLSLELRVSHRISAGTSNQIYVQVGKQHLKVANQASRGDVYDQRFDLDEAFGSSVVPLADVKRISITSRGGDDQMGPEKISLQGVCAGSREKVRFDYGFADDSWIAAGIGRDIHVKPGDWVRA